MRRYFVPHLGIVIVPLSLCVFIISLLIWTDSQQIASASIPTIYPQAITDPIDCNIARNLFVGVDISQGQDPNDAASFLADLESDGFEVGTFDLANGIPACLDVILIFGLANGNQLDAVYPASQGTTLLNWVNNGGGLMLFGEWGFLKAETEPLFQAFGYAQQGDDAGVVSDATDSDPAAPAIVGDTWVIYQIDNFSAHPAFNGVSAIELLRSSWLNSSVNTIVQTDSDAVPAEVSVMAASVQGNGCVLLSADTNWVGEIDGAYQKEDNALFARQMVDWLTNCGTLSLTKQPNAATVNAGELVTFTMTAINNRATAVSGVVITDAVPAGTSFVTASTPFTGPDAASVVTWSMGTLAPGASATATLVVEVASDTADETTIINTAAVSSNEGAMDSATAVVTVAAIVPPIDTSSITLLPIIMVDFCVETDRYADVVLALDTSGSMDNSTEPGGPSKLAAARTAATEFLNLLTFPGDQAGIVLFSGTAVLQQPLSSNRDSLIAALQGNIDGDTRLDLALAEARKELTSGRHLPNNSQILILLTDGRPSGTDATTVLSQATITKNAGITIYTIGLGNDVNGALLQDIATTAGHYFPAPSTADLNQIYHEIAGSISCP